MKKRLLLYNWERIDGVNGGGVRQYLLELIEGLVQDGSYEIFFLNSGRKYTFDEKMRIEKTINSFAPTVHSYEVFNSPVIAPGNQSMKNLEMHSLDDRLHILIKEFIKQKQIQIVHYHNIEGLTQKTLELKNELPSVKFICSLHNYYPVCPEVNLWKNDEEVCNDFDASDCSKCYLYANYDLTKFRFQHLDIPGLKDIFLDYSRQHPDVGKEGTVDSFRKRNIEAFNKYFDALLVPSVRTKKMYTSRGVKKDLLHVSYAGSKIAGDQVKEGKHENRDDGILNVLYMGYLRREKGFYFLLDGLKKLPKNIAAKIHVTLLVQNKDLEKEATRILQDSKGNFYGVDCINGYKDHAELKSILAVQDIGIVPILWEDPLPRIAMEQIACGVPILASNFGGTKELIGDIPEFIFNAGEVEDFVGKLSNFVEHRGDLHKFWEKNRHLVSIKEHIHELKKYYEN